MAALEILKGLMDEAQANLATAQAKVQAFQDLSQSIETEMKAAVDKAWQEGKDSVILPDPTSPDKLFTQADMDALAAQAKLEKEEEVRAELQPKIDQLSVETQTLGVQLESANARIESVKAGALSSIQKLKLADDVLADNAAQEIVAL